MGEACEELPEEDSRGSIREALGPIRAVISARDSMAFEKLWMTWEAARLRRRGLTDA